MKFLITTLIILSTTNSFAFFEKSQSEKDQERKEKEMKDKYRMTCVSVQGNLTRCENDEVICYGGSASYANGNVGDAGVSCKFKGGN